MKIALCLHGKFFGKNNRGEMQGFEIPFKAFRDKVLTEDVDVFFHGWDDDVEASNSLIKLVNPKSYILETQKIFNHPYQDYNFIPAGQWNTRSCINNNYSRYYSMKESVKLVDESYDLIMVARFDTVIYEYLDFSLFKPGNFYVSNWNLLHEGWGFNDAWFISGNKLMRDFSLIYDRLDDYFNIKNNSEYFQFLKRYNLNEANLASGHAITKYRTIELGLQNNLYAYGLEYKTWGLLRRLDLRTNPWGVPEHDTLRPFKIANEPYE